MWFSTNCSLKHLGHKNISIICENSRAFSTFELFLFTCSKFCHEKIKQDTFLSISISCDFFMRFFLLNCFSLYIARGYFLKRLWIWKYHLIIRYFLNIEQRRKFLSLQISFGSSYFIGQISRSSNNLFPPVFFHSAISIFQHLKEKI